MEKKIEFLQNRTASQLADLIDRLVSDLRYEIVSNLEPITSDSKSHEVTHHDVACMNVISLCSSLSYVINELKSTFYDTTS